MKTILFMVTVVFSAYVHAEQNVCEKFIGKMNLAIESVDESLIPSAETISSELSECQVYLVGKEEEDATTKEKYIARRKAVRDMVAATQVLCPLKASQGSALGMALCYRDLMQIIHDASRF